MKLFYPRVLSEDETLDQALRGRNLSRYGDGELRLMLGGTAASQKADPGLAKELSRILADPDPRILACIPNAHSESPKAKNWSGYTISKFTDHYKLKTYGSSFITRPDSAPWIDRPDYWEKIKSIWSGKDVVLVIGSKRSLTPDNMLEAKSVQVIWGFYRDSYTMVDELMEWIGKPSKTVILCLGAAGTALAYRLAKLDVHALDMGHVGMMVKHAGTGRWEAKANESRVA